MPIYLSQSPRNAYSNFSNALINVHNGEISPPGGGEDFYKPIIRRRCNEVTRDEVVSFYRGQETETKGESERSVAHIKGTRPCLSVTGGYTLDLEIQFDSA